MGRRKKTPLSKSLSRLKREAKGTAMSALGFVPGLGMALGVVDTTRRASRTMRAARQTGRALRAEVRRRYR